MARRYRVTTNLLMFASQGDEVSADDHPDIAFPALEQGGFVEAIAPSVPCPACSEQGLKKKDVPNFQKAETLEEHYRKEHPGLAAPDFEEVV